MRSQIGPIELDKNIVEAVPMVLILWIGELGVTLIEIHVLDGWEEYFVQKPAKILQSTKQSSSNANGLQKMGYHSGIQHLLLANIKYIEGINIGHTFETSLGWSLMGNSGFHKLRFAIYIRECKLEWCVIEFHLVDI